MLQLLLPCQLSGVMCTGCKLVCKTGARGGGTGGTSSAQVPVCASWSRTQKLGMLLCGFRAARLLTTRAPYALTACAPYALTARAPYALTACAPYALTARAPHAMTACAPYALTACAPYALTTRAPHAMTARAPYAMFTLHTRSGKQRRG